MYTIENYNGKIIQKKKMFDLIIYVNYLQKIRTIALILQGKKMTKKSSYITESVKISYACLFMRCLQKKVYVNTELNLWRNYFSIEGARLHNRAHNHKRRLFKQYTKVAETDFFFHVVLRSQVRTFTLCMLILFIWM